MKKVVLAVVLATTLSGSYVPAANAGPLRDFIKEGVRHPIDTTKLIVRVAKCRLTGHGNTVLC